MVATEAQRRANNKFLNKCIQNIPSAMPHLLPSEHAERKRILPPNTPRPGPIDIRHTEYYREIIDNFAPWSPIQQTSWMKAVQVGATTAAECIIIYFMDHAPSDLLYLTAKGDNVKRWVNRLEHAIDSYGIRELFVSTAGPEKGRSSADKSIQKNYKGCQANFGSLRSLADMSSETKRVVIRDEPGQVPIQLASGHGSVMEISYSRTNFWGKLRKILDISTPGASGSCAMEIEFLKGDQRYFWVPCPKCGEWQLLEFDRLWSANDKKIIDASYICSGPKECELKNYHKDQMIPEGLWVPTVETANPYHRSYQLSALYAPIGSIDWNEILAKKIEVEASDDPDAERQFNTLIKGVPHHETGKRPKITLQNPLRTARKSKELHDDIIFLTAAVDVQTGHQDPRMKKPRRLELNVMGHGSKHRAWHIEHVVFEGEVMSPDGEAWEKLLTWHDELIDNPYQKADESDLSGMPMFVFIDSGVHTQAVYEICSTRANYYPIKGFDSRLSTKNQNPEIDEQTAKNFVRFKPTNIGPGIRLYNIATNYYRAMLYQNVYRTQRHLEGPKADEKYGYLGFPNDYTDEMFNQLTAAEVLADGTFDKKNRAAEQMDLFVYNLCAGDVFIELRVQERRNRLKDNRLVNRNKIKNYNTAFALLEMKFEMGTATEEEVQRYQNTMADFMVF